MAKDYIVVTAISTYRMRYVMHKDDLAVASPGIKTTLTGGVASMIKVAHNAVATNEYEEFSQEHVGEFIVDTYEVTEDDMLNLFDKENSYLTDWSKERKLEWVRKTIEDWPPEEVPI